MIAFWAISVFSSWTSVCWAQKTPYPAAKHGGNYMFNYYIPPAPSTTAWGTRLVS